MPFQKTRRNVSFSNRSISSSGREICKQRRWIKANTGQAANIYKKYQHTIKREAMKIVSQRLL